MLVRVFSVCVCLSIHACTFMFPCEFVGVGVSVLLFVYMSLFTCMTICILVCGCVYLNVLTCVRMNSCVSDCL